MALREEPWERLAVVQPRRTLQPREHKKNPHSAVVPSMQHGSVASYRYQARMAQVSWVNCLLARHHRAPLGQVYEGESLDAALLRAKEADWVLRAEFALQQEEMPATLEVVEAAVLTRVVVVAAVVWIALQPLAPRA